MKVFVEKQQRQEAERNGNIKCKICLKTEMEAIKG